MKETASRLGRRLTAGLIILAGFTFTSMVFASTGAGEEVYHRIVDFGNGLTYTNSVSVNDSGRQESYFAEITPGSDAVPAVIADDTIYGKMTLDQTVSHAENLGYTVLGGMNTDFFSPAYGIPLGIVVENGQYKSSPEGYRSVCFTADGHADIQDDTAVQITMANQGGSPSANNAGEGVALTHFNKYRTNNAGLYLYDEYFSTVSTRTSGNGWYVKFRILEGSMKTKGTMKLEVTEKLRSSYPLDIGEGYMVLTAGDASGLGVDYQKFDVGDIVQLDTHCWGNPVIEQAVWATGAGDLIVDNGQITDSSSWDPAIKSVNPRSALGIKADGTVVYYTIDGRSRLSRGLTLQQLAEEMLRRGCVKAVNLDGGGSTTFSIQFPNQDQPSLQNRPSDGAERKCSTFVLYTLSELSDGLPAHLYLTDLGAIVYQGSRVNLEYMATDRACQPCDPPTDIETGVISGPGSVQEGIFTAGIGDGYVDFSLNSPSTGASGTTQLLVTSRLDSISVSVEGAVLSGDTIIADEGSSFRLSASASRLDRPVIINRTGFIWQITEGIGRIAEDGTVTADAPGNGEITVSAGGISRTLNLAVNEVPDPADEPGTPDVTDPEPGEGPGTPDVTDPEPGEGPGTPDVTDPEPGTVDDPDPSEFSDTRGTWVQPYVTDLYQRGIVKGMSEDLYGAALDIRRGDFVLMLYRAAGSPEAEGASPFEDVPSGKYYSDAVVWASSKNIARGTGEGFSPEAPLTREQSFALVHRYLILDEKKASVLNAPDLSVLTSFSDEDRISDYAKIPAAALTEQSIIGGADGRLMPKDHLTRAQMARILSSALEYMEKNQ